MITVFIATATAKAVNLEERLFMGISEVSAVIDPYRDNTASTVPVAKTSRKEHLEGQLIGREAGE